MARRSGDFALAAVAATLKLSNGILSDARIAAMGVSETPLRLRDVEQLLNEHQLRELDADLLARMAQEISQAVEPNTDLQASADYRRHLLGVLGRRAIKAAWDRAKKVAQ